MNLINQLQQTPKWKEFRTWYNQQNYRVGLEHANDESMFIELEFEFQKGVFEKFIESKNYQVHYDGSYNLYNRDYVLVNGKLPHWNTFEELLIWYFNN